MAFHPLLVLMVSLGVHTHTVDQAGQAMGFLAVFSRADREDGILGMGFADLVGSFGFTHDGVLE